eukprot:6192727-Pleurochrysis_carterae.AAC.1
MVGQNWASCERHAQLREAISAGRKENAGAKARSAGQSGHHVLGAQERWSSREPAFESTERKTPAQATRSCARRDEPASYA